MHKRQILIASLDAIAAFFIHHLFDGSERKIH